MKSRMILFAAAAMAMVACNKETTPTTFEAGQQVTITVNAGDAVTRVTGTDTGDDIAFVWEKDDKIKVTVGSSSSVFWLIDGAGTKVGSFMGLMPAGGKSFNVTYPASGEVDLSSQTYEAGKVSAGTMSYKATGCTDPFAVQLSANNTSILQINLTGTETISMLTLSATDVSKTYTLNISPAVTLTSTPTAFYFVTCPMTSKLKLTVSDSAGGYVTSFSTSEKKTLTNGACLNLESKAVTKSNCLPGEFSVSATKKVRFTRGNLYYSTTDNSYHIEAAQNQNSYLLGQSSYTPSHVCHFFWSSTTDYLTSGMEPWAETYSCSTESESDIFFCDETNKLTVDGQSGLYALTTDEWEYLLNEHAKVNGARAHVGDLYGYNITITTSAGEMQHCLILAPDDWDYTNHPVDYSHKSSYSTAEWAEAEANGLVCLPPTCERSNFSSASTGYYWTPHFVTNYQSGLYYSALEFSISYVNWSLGGYRHNTDNPSNTDGYAIRLVSTVE